MVSYLPDWHAFHKTNQTKKYNRINNYYYSYIIIYIYACGMLVHSSSMAVPYYNPTRTPLDPQRWHQQTVCSPTRHHTCCLPSAMYSENRDSSMKRTPLQSARRHRMWAFAHSSRLRRRTAVWLRPRWGWWAADELPWDGFWQFV